MSRVHFVSQAQADVFPAFGGGPEAMATSFGVPFLGASKGNCIKHLIWITTLQRCLLW
jgi:hypothetical protein